MGPTAARAGTSLLWLGWTRLLVAAFVFCAGAWLRYAGAFPYPFELFVLALGGMGVNALLVLLVRDRSSTSPAVAVLQVSLDAALVTAIVATSGGPRSLFSFVYVLVVMEACLLLSRASALVVAGVASLLYVVLVVIRTVIPLAFLAEPTEATGLEVLTVFVNAGVLMVSAIVAGSLAEQYRTAARDLEAQQRHLSDVQAFRDLIFQSVGTGLIAVGPEGRISAFNRAAEIITGVPAAEALGDTWTTIFGRTIDLDAVRAEITGSDGQSQRHELQLQRRDGRLVPVGVSFWLLRSGEGHAAGLIGVCQDLSSIKQMEERMRRADRLAALGRLSANIAHEIRNPLASISGAIETLARDLPPDATRSRLVEIVLHESERLNGLIAEFLDYARPAPMTLMDVDLAKILDEILLLLEHRPLPDGVKVVREYAEGLLTRADPQQLRQAVWNLCLNAAQSMPSGGELRVGGRVTSRRDGGRSRVQIWVADTGHGIPADDLPHIYEPFYSTKASGTGLGLAVVYRTVQDHAGSIEVRSHPGAGTTFTLDLPAIASPA